MVPVQEIQLAAVGDLLVKRYLIADARKEDGSYSFDPLFAPVSDELRRADFTIGNLETTFAGPRGVPQKKSAGPRFTCPDALAPALKRAGFNMLITANNHCMDYGAKGLLRTLRILDRCGIAHAGTYASLAASQQPYIAAINGIKLGLLTYTKSTNGIKLPAGKPWLVNRLSLSRLVRDVKRLRRKVDVVIAYLHFGNEYYYKPTAAQKRCVRLLFKHGADIVLGSHPHVLQPIAFRGSRRLVSYSLGNFVSTRLKNNPHTQVGVILTLKIRKDDAGKIQIGVRCIPTCVVRKEQGGRHVTQVVPIREALKGSGLTREERKHMARMLAHASRTLRGPSAAKTRLRLSGLEEPPEIKDGVSLPAAVSLEQPADF